MRREEPEPYEVEDRIKYLVNIMYEESYSLGYALRRHNARATSSQGKTIIVQNVLEDWMSMSYDLSLERTAAVVHLQTILMISKMLHEWMTKLENFKSMSYLSGIIKTDLVRMKQAIDLRDDIWELGGYNIERADQGMFEEVEKRNRTFSCIRDYVTTTATTQMGQGATEVSHIDGWDIPLMPRDGRNPPSQPDHPGWDPSPIRMMNDKQQREADAQRAQQQQQQTGPSSSTAGGHDGYSSAAESAPPPKAPPSKARPSTPPARKDWVIPRVPNGYLFRTSSMPDQRNSEFITSAWMDERDHFLLSIVQGPAAQAASTLGSAPWAQYLRRVTAYACMIFGVCNPGVVTEDTASTISEKDWLRCYSHIVRKYMLTRTGCYLSTAGMLMMLGHHDVNVANQSDLGRVKKMITNPLACRIIEAPSGPRDHDMLAGDFRAGTTILITDLMFRVGTQSGTHGIQMGLADMGWESVEVFKIHDSEAERPLQQFLDTLDKVKQHLSTDTVDDGLVVIAVPTFTKTTSLCYA